MNLSAPGVIYVPSESARGGRSVEIAAFPVAPGDNVLSKPRLLDQFLSQNGIAGLDEVPPLRECRQLIHPKSVTPLDELVAVCLAHHRLPAQSVIWGVTAEG